jgi:dTDP-4-amino-4,6-dideoxygalactose transaminase
MKSEIFVTKPFMPPLEEFIPYLESIWSSKVLTNCGPFHEKLESALCEYLEVDHVSLFSNGTLGLLTALQALNVTGDVITTPYSFVATSNALHWHGNTPVFVDVDAKTLNINPEMIEAAITPQTTAIMAMHCYGQPCDVELVQAIADKHDLKVIYDACHAFGVKDMKGSVLRHGNLSILSFHATKVFNTFEGGAIICPDKKTKIHIDHLKNFGIVDETTVVAPGINGKMSELNAAFGLLQLKYVDQAIKKRAAIDLQYRKGLKDVVGIQCIPDNVNVGRNYSYFPILVGDNFPITRDDLYSRLKSQGINGRRYFYPLITDFLPYRKLQSASPANLPVANRVSKQVLCLPMYPDLQEDVVQHICLLIAGVGES